MFCVGSASANYNWSLGGTNDFANGYKSSVLGATTITFDALSLPSGVTYAGGKVVQGLYCGPIGTCGSVTAAPPAGDTSKYFTVGPTDGSVGSFKSTFYNSYFGFNFSSPDSYNTISFLRDGNTVISYSGTDLANQIDGVGGLVTGGDRNASWYLNVSVDNAAQYFNEVRFSSSSNAFETDNHAFIAVPEPETYAMLLAGLGLMGFVARRRKQAVAA